MPQEENITKLLCSLTTQEVNLESPDFSQQQNSPTSILGNFGGNNLPPPAAFQ